jgi:hypothetical protein
VPLERDYKCDFFVEGLYPEPKFQAHISPLLAVFHAMRIAIRDLEAVGAEPTE